MKLSILLLFALLVCSQALCGQILNIDRNITNDSVHPRRPKGLIGLSFSADKQKKNLIDGSGSADFSFFWPKNIVSVLILRTDLTWNGREVIQNSGFFHFRTRDNDLRKVFPELFSQYQWNGALGMEQRVLAGGNLRWRAIHKKDNDLFVALGVMFEAERWNYRGVKDASVYFGFPPERRELLKVNQYIKWGWKISPRLDFVLSNFYQARPTQLLKPRLATQGAFHFSVMKGLGFSAQYESLYDFAPVVPIDKYYYSVKGAINFSF
jgi:hypothetical protein